MDHWVIALILHARGFWQENYCSLVFKSVKKTAFIFLLCIESLRKISKQIFSVLHYFHWWKKTPALIHLKSKRLPKGGRACWTTTSTSVSIFQSLSSRFTLSVSQPRMISNPLLQMGSLIYFFFFHSCFSSWVCMNFFAFLRSTHTHVCGMSRVRRLLHPATPPAPTPTPRGSDVVKMRYRWLRVMMMMMVMKGWDIIAAPCVSSDWSSSAQSFPRSDGEPTATTRNTERDWTLTGRNLIFSFLFFFWSSSVRLCW